jgi:hypothetical protein
MPEGARGHAGGGSGPYRRGLGGLSEEGAALTAETSGTDINVTSTFEPAEVRLGVVRGISYGLFGAPGEFVGQARGLGAGMIRAYFYWGQVEPEPGRYRWEAVDALLGQLTGDEEVWITLCSSSPWGTRVASDFLPPSPARDQGAYGEFVRRMVGHCGGRVRYWQCDNEPSNTDLLWAGTAAEYVEQLTTFYRAVKDADPAAGVVLGGCGYDVFSSEPGSAAGRCSSCSACTCTATSRVCPAIWTRPAS